MGEDTARRGGLIGQCYIVSLRVSLSSRFLTAADMASRGPCRTRSTPKVIEQIKVGLAKEQVLSKRQSAFTPRVINVHFNILAANMTYEGGWVPYVSAKPPCYASLTCFFVPQRRANGRPDSTVERRLRRDGLFFPP